MSASLTDGQHPRLSGPAAPSLGAHGPALEAGLRHLRPGGTLIVDDYRSDRPDGYPLPEVTRAVDDFVTRHGRLFEPPLVWNVRGKGFCALRALGGATAK